MIDWFKKHRVLFALICVVILLLLMGVPFVINILFKINATTDILVAEWSAVMHWVIMVQSSPFLALWS